MDIDSVADELYGMPLEQFVAARTAREREARAAGDRELAEQIHRLAKPSLVAWTANQLVRQQRDEIEPLLALGAQVREAAAGLSAEQLRELSRQQHHVIHAVVRQAAELSRDQGRGFSDTTERGLQDTLHAALVDPEVADVLAAGRLTEAAQRSGLEALSPGAAAAPAARRPAAQQRRTAQSSGESSRGSKRARAAERERADELTRARRRRAERGLEQARSARVEAEADREAAANRLAKAEADVETAEKQVRRLRAELDAAVEVHEQAEAGRQQARADSERADEAVDAAAKRQADAEAELAAQS